MGVGDVLQRFPRILSFSLVRIRGINLRTIIRQANLFSSFGLGRVKACTYRGALSIGQISFTIVNFFLSFYEHPVLKERGIKTPLAPTSP